MQMKLNKKYIILFTIITVLIIFGGFTLYKNFKNKSINNTKIEKKVNKKNDNLKNIDKNNTNIIIKKEKIKLIPNPSKTPLKIIKKEENLNIDNNQLKNLKTENNKNLDKLNNSIDTINTNIEKLTDTISNLNKDFQNISERLSKVEKKEYISKEELKLYFKMNNEKLTDLLSTKFEKIDSNIEKLNKNNRIFILKNNINKKEEKITDLNLNAKIISNVRFEYIDYSIDKSLGKIAYLALKGNDKIYSATMDSTIDTKYILVDLDNNYLYIKNKDDDLLYKLRKTTIENY